MTDASDIDNWFKHHPPIGTQTSRYEAIRAKAKELALLILVSCPESDERDNQAFSYLREAVFWANASIACNEPEPIPLTRRAAATGSPESFDPLRTNED